MNDTKESVVTEQQARETADNISFEDRFMHDLYHNTKNPLQIINSSVNLLKKDITPEERENLYQNIQTSVKKIDEMLNELLYVHYSSGNR